LPTGRGYRMTARETVGPLGCARARCGHCSACASNQMLRRTLPTAERTVTPVRQTEKSKWLLTRETRLENGPLGSRASTRKLTSGSTAVMCPAYVTRCHDRWPRWVPRSSPKQHVDLEGRRYYRVLWILGSSDRHLDELSHPAATRRLEGGSARRIVTQAATWVIRSPGHSRSRAAIHDSW